jgi:hypothetical protein
MNRLTVGGNLALLVAACLVLGQSTPARAEKGHHDQHAAAFDKCARACAACMRECESCANHCLHLVAQGKKQHLRTVGTCTDCATFCAAAARIVAHQGPLARLICESCAKACEDCKGASEKVGPGDDHMQRCAKACASCAQACREMIQHLGHKAAAAGASARQE